MSEDEPETGDSAPSVPSEDRESGTGGTSGTNADDSTAVDVETERQTPGPQGDEPGIQTATQGDGTGRAQGGGHEGTSRNGPASGGTGGQRDADEKYCSNCGTVISQQAVVCPECGVEQANAQGQGTAQSGGGSDPGVAALLSGIGFFIPLATGAGQVYNGDIAKGVLFTVIQLVNVGLVFLLVGIITYPIVGVIAIYDAYKSAQR